MSRSGITRGLLLGAAVWAPTLAMAQSPGPPDDGPPPAQRPQGEPGDAPGEDRPPFPGPPIMAALDTDRDGKLSPEEIRNATASLQVLDHNHDGTLDRSELDPRGGGPDGPGGPPRGGRFGGPPGEGPDGPPDGGPPPGAGRGRPSLGHVLPPFVRDELSLSSKQTKQIADLEKTMKGKLESILTPGQLRQVRDLMERGPGGRGPGGRRGPGPGGPPRGGTPGDDDEGPPVRPRRP